MVSPGPVREVATYSSSPSKRRHETVHSHSTSGDGSEDWISLGYGHAREQRHAVCEIAAQHAEDLPKLEEFYAEG
jgi:hypothetical protein